MESRTLNKHHGTRLARTFPRKEDFPHNMSTGHDEERLPLVTFENR